MRITLKYNRGDTVYIVRNVWDSKQNKRIQKITRTLFVSYLIYPENPIRILCKCTANESWVEIEDVYPTKEKALKAIEREDKRDE